MQHVCGKTTCKENLKLSQDHINKDIHIKLKCHNANFCNYSSQLFKSFEFGNGSRISDENLVILKFKYLQSRTKNGRNKLYLKSARTHWLFSFYTQITDKNSQFPFKNWRFSTFTTFSLHSWSSVDADFCISSSCYVMSGTRRSFCS